MSECPHGLDQRWCSVCLRGPKPRPVAVTVEATFEARYAGQCPACNLPITVGQTICRLSDESYVHQDCSP